MQPTKRTFKNITGILFCTALLLISCDTAFAKELTIVFTGDINGHVEPCG